MFCMLKNKKIYPAYVLKHNSNIEKQVILLMFPNGEKWDYLAIKKLSFRTKNELESHKRICKNKYFCNVIIITN